MFNRVFGMMVSGDLDELPRRRGGAIVWDPKAGGFVAEESPAHSDWPGRGEVPGATARVVTAAPAAATPTSNTAATAEAQTLADELRAFAVDPVDEP